MEVRKKFKPLAGKGEFAIHRPIRAKVREVFTIAAETSDLEPESRVKYARMAGMQAVEGKINLSQTYNGYTAVPALARALFENFPAEFNEDDLDEGEVNAAFLSFVTQRNGI